LTHDQTPPAHLRDVLVDDLFEFDSFEHRRDHSQLSKITTLNILGVSIAGKCIQALSLEV
jgi:hypothetical protein